MKTTVEGRFRVEVVERETDEVVRELRFGNLVTNAGLEYLAAGGSIDSIIEYLGVGTGTTAPVVGDTALETPEGARSNTGGIADVFEVGDGNAYVEITRIRSIGFDAEVQLTELGFFDAATDGTMWTRQLFRDDLGDPTVVTVTEEQTLRVAYTWRVNLQLTPSTVALEIDEVEVDVAGRAYKVDGDAYAAAGIAVELGLVDVTPALFQAFESNELPALTAELTEGEAADSVEAVAHAGGTFVRDVDVVFEAETAVFETGIGAIVAWPFNGAPAIVHTFDPKIPKDDTVRFTFRTRMTYARAGA